jgi:molybdopterin converting factor small subunit
MSVKIIFMGILAEKTGTTEMLSPGGVLKTDLVNKLVESYPALSGMSFITAVNGTVFHGEKEIADGDLVTLIPPAPGG